MSKGYAKYERFITNFSTREGSCECIGINRHVVLNITVTVCTKDQPYGDRMHK